MRKWLMIQRHLQRIPQPNREILSDRIVDVAFVARDRIYFERYERQSDRRIRNIKTNCIEASVLQQSCMKDYGLSFWGRAYDVSQKPQTTDPLTVERYINFLIQRRPEKHFRSMSPSHINVISFCLPACMPRSIIAV